MITKHVYEGEKSTPNSLCSTGRQLPEAFIWIVFRGLAEALYMLFSGKAIAIDQPNEASAKVKDPALRVQARIDGWRPIVNTDIKMANVVLTDPGATFPAYKTPKMIDFGNCFDTDTVVERHTRERGVGTPGWRPPVRCYFPGHVFSVLILFLGAV